MLHGCTQSPDDFAAGTSMNEIAEEQTFPGCLSGTVPVRQHLEVLELVQPGDQQRDQGEPALIAGITRQIMRDFSVAPGRVHIAGLSAGRRGGHHGRDVPGPLCRHRGSLRPFAAPPATCRQPSRRCATAGRGSRWNGPSGGPVPTIVFHGDRDATVNPVNGDQVIIASGNHRSGFADQRQPRRGTRRPWFTRTVKTMRAGDRWLSNGLHGPATPGPVGARPDPTEPRGPDASREMIRFFLQHPAAAASGG